MSTTDSAATTHKIPVSAVSSVSSSASCAIEPIIEHLKAEGHLGRCYLKGRAGDAANIVLSAIIL